MIALVQRVARAEVRVAGVPVGAIGSGLLAFVCAEAGDDETLAERLVERLLKLRVFGDDQGRMNRCLTDVAGGLLVVSQFTLAAEFTGGNRPSYSRAAPAAQAEALYERVLAGARARHAPVAAGRFGADMQIELVNDGPVTIPITLRHPARVATP